MKKLLSLPSFDDEELGHSAGILHVMTLVSISVAVMYSVITIATAHANAYSISLLGVIVGSVILAQVLMRRGRVRLAGWLFLIMFWVIITLTVFVTGGINAPGYVVYLTVIVVASLLLGSSGGLLFTLLSATASFAFLILQFLGYLPAPLISYDPISQWMIGIINMLVLSFAVLLSVRRMYQNLDRVMVELKERRRTEEALLEAEAQYRALVEQVPSIVYTAEFGQSGHWLFVSPQIEKISGFSVREWMDNRELWYQQLHIEDRERVIQEETFSRTSGEALRSEYRLLAKDGSEIWFRDEAAVIRDTSGQPLFLQGVMYDITDRKKIEAKLIQSERKFRQLADLLPQIVFEADTTGRITFANQTAFDVFGYSREEFDHGLNALQMIVPEQRQRGLENIQRILRNEPASDHEYHAVTRDGRIFPALIFSTPIVEGQTVTGFRGVIVDITERKHAEEELARSEERFRSTFNNAPIGMAIVGLDERIQQVNRALCEILGYSSEQLLGRTIAEITYPEDREIETNEKGGALERPGDAFSLEKRYLHAKGGIVWGQLNVSLVRDIENRPLYYLGQMQDITERKRAEQSLRESEQRFQSLYKDVERQAQELLLLHRVRNAMSTELDLPSVIRSVVEAIADAFGYALVSLYLLEGDALHLQHQIGYGEGVIRQIPVAKGVCGRVVRTRTPLLISDVHTEPDFIGAIANISSEVCVPLFDRGNVAGVLNIESTHGVFLTKADLQLMTALSEYVSLAIERSRLYTETRNNEARFRALLENSTDVISVLDIYENVLYTSPSTQRVLGYRVNDFLGSNFFSRIHTDDVGWVRALFSEHVTIPGNKITAEFRYQHRDGSWRWIEWLATNALNDPGIRGVITNYRDITTKRLTEDVMLTRAGRQSILAQIGQTALVETDVFTLMANIVDLVAETFGVEFCKILELQPDGNSFLLRAGVGWKKGFVGSAVVTAGRNSQAGFTLLNRGPVMVEDLRKETRFKGPELLLEHGVISGLSVVIEGRGRPYGVVGVHSRQPHVFSVEDGYFLQSIANVLGAAIGRFQADDALRSSEERYMLVATGANDGLWDWNLAANSIYYSPRWKEMLGFAGNELRDDIEEWFQRIHPVDQEQVRRVFSPNLNTTATRFEIDYQIRHRDGSYRWVLNRGVIIRDPAGKAQRMAGSMSDITERKKAEQQLQFDAFHDPLTGLFNRAYLIERLAHVIRFGERRSSYRFAVLFLDLDEFKIVNDRFGHTVGDQFLREVAGRLGRCTRSVDTLARLGGDEFIILLEDITSLQEAARVAERIQLGLSDVFELSDVKITASASIGIVYNDFQYETPEEVLRDADIAMYSAKASGKARYQIFSVALREQTIRRLEREVDLRHALERDQFRIFYQPIYSFPSKQPVGVEALLRWKHPTQGLVPPGEFIRIAEDSNLIIPIDCFVLYKACLQIREWERKFPAVASWDVHVNLSSKHFVQPNLVETIQKIIRDADFDPARVVLEITESAIMEDIDIAVLTTRQLNDLGVQIAIDDFGTGYSSLNYLTRFPVDILKLDQSFVPRINTDPNTREIIDTVVKLAHKLGIKVVAEGVETTGQLSELQALGCEFGQGYLFSKPIDKDAVMAMVGGTSS